MRESTVTTGNLWLILLLITIAIFHAVTIRQGHIWADDFAMYIHHAQNSVEGRPYAQTGYLFTPTALVGPRMYPPVFPLLLAPVVRFFGVNLIPMKFEQVIFFVLALAVSVSTGSAISARIHACAGNHTRLQSTLLGSQRQCALRLALLTPSM